jgi:hypothetical protein
MSSKVSQRAYTKALGSHLVAREPYRLRDLAVRMRDTGGPVEAMDASLASLGPCQRRPNPEQVSTSEN